jgi:thiamine-monophosphate kinase
MSQVMSLGEFDIIARYFATPRPQGDVLLGIGDDAAVLNVRADRKLVVAMDTIVDGVHFPIGTAATDIGYRALAVNLSDLAAMGAEPSWMTLSLALREANEAWIAGFAAGLFEIADRFNVTLAGGDTVKGPLVITVQVAGWVEPDRWLTRSGARPGDRIFVSGIPGEAAAGLVAIQKQLPDSAAVDHLRQRFLRPEPRIALGRALRTVASAAMDISDGLLTDLGKLCAASDCGARIDIDALPGSEAMSQLFDADSCVDYALAGGDDYELLFTVPESQAAELARQLTGHVACRQIGVITDAPGVECWKDRRPYAVRRTGYDHFASEPPYDPVEP